MPRMRPPSTRIMLPVIVLPHIARPSDANARANPGMPSRSSPRWSMYSAGDIGVLLRLARCIPYSRETPRLMTPEQPRAEGVRPDFGQAIKTEHLG